MKKILSLLKKNKLIICVALAAVAALAFAFASGGSLDNAVSTADTAASVSAASALESSSESASKVSASSASKQTAATAEGTKPSESSGQSEPSTEPGSADSTSGALSQSSESSQSKSSSESSGEVQETTKDKYQTDAVPEGKPEPVEPQEQEVSDETLYCTFSISCATVLDNMEYLTEGKESLIPDDGWIFSPTELSFSKGESVFDILQRVCRENNIHMEYSQTPMYNSAYVEGINNLYEFDCTSKSGWMYRVNGWFPNYGISRYSVADGDVVELIYTCDYGYDIGSTSTDR